MPATQSKFIIYEDEPERRMYVTGKGEFGVGLFNGIQGAHEWDSREEAEKVLQWLNAEDTFFTHHFEFVIEEVICG